MDFLSIIIIGIGLAMDCFAVSISKGMCIKKVKWKKVLRMAFLFGLFQAGMPLIGYFAGMSFAKLISSFDHWLAFILLGGIGVKMFIEGLKPIDPHCETKSNPFKWKTLLTLSFATSIDALATGIVFVPYPDKIWFAVLSIGLISFLFSIIGVYLGVNFRKKIKINVEILGGIILIGIGSKILIEHLVNS
ncbi:MAG: manganese efflux pump MntP family protein [Paludibacter sp.]|nr:manganese efflux pump MntP family protein [Paludibacter sp.]